MKVENPQSCLPIRSRKWALKFCMATSAAFLRWHPGGTSFIAILYSSLIIVVIASNTLFWHNPGVLQVCHQHSICSGDFVVVSAIDGFDQDCIAVYFDYDHYVFVAPLGLHGKLSCLVRENCFTYVIHLREYITYFLVRELRCVGFFERGPFWLFPCCGFGFC